MSLHNMRLRVCPEKFSPFQHMSTESSNGEFTEQRERLYSKEISIVSIVFCSN
jgi:hypothetical protein